jgi:hypothetical protein
MTTKARTAMAPSARRLHTMLFVLIAAAATMVVLTVPATARAAPSGPRGSAFVWANQPSSANYLPSPAYQWNSRHSFTAVNTITRSGVGSYTVRLPDLGAVSGTVLVTAYGPTANNCKVLSWGPSGTAQLVNIRCFTATGVLADTRFTMSYANQTGVVGSDLAYVWADQPTAASYVPSQPYQANSSSATNRIQRLGTGSYLVKLPNLGRSAGHVQVTAYGPGPERCKVVSWGPIGTEQDIKVLCNTRNGTPVDTRFTLTYVRNGNVLGEPVCCQPDGNPTDYAWANQPTAASYTPSPLYQFSIPAQQITISRLTTGSYAVHVPDTLNNGNVQVTAYGSNSAQCKVNFWTPAAGIRVLCFRSGSPIDTRFDVSFVGPFVIG